MNFVAVATLVLAVAPAVTAIARAEQIRPDPTYFTGVYERVGRTGTEPRALINDLVRIAPAPEGWGLMLSSCAPGKQPDGWPLELRASEFDEVPNIVATSEGPFALCCQYFNDHSNYPILACQSDMGRLSRSGPSPMSVWSDA